MAVINSKTILNIRVTPINPTAVFVSFVPSAACLSLSLPLLLSFPYFSFSLVTLFLASCLHTYKMGGSGEVPIQNSFVVQPAPYPLSSCRGDPGEPYHSSICKCTCTWTTAWACWDCKLIYANLGETVTTQSRTPTPVVISPRQHNSQLQALKMCRKFRIMGGAVLERKKTI